MEQKVDRTLLPVRELSEVQLRQVNTLAGDCRREDGFDTHVFIEPEFNTPETQNNQFLYYADEELAGIACLSGGDEVEAQLLVHPDYRRRGIGRLLLEAVRDECRIRGLETVLLVCDHASLSGCAFAESLGAELGFSEYLLQYDLSAAETPTRPVAEPIQLLAVGEESRDTLISLNAASQEETPESVGELIRNWLSEANQQFYIGKNSNGQDVGVLRVASFEDEVYICTFSVLPNLRGRGYGRQMLAHIVTVLSQGNKPIRLEVESENRNALSLYHSVGFREVTAYRYYRLLV